MVFGLERVLYFEGRYFVRCGLVVFSGSFFFLYGSFLSDGYIVRLVSFLKVSYLGVFFGYKISFLVRNNVVWNIVRRNNIFVGFINGIVCGYMVGKEGKF